MLKVENVETMGWEPALRGMRNPKNSWKRSDSHWCEDESTFDAPCPDDDCHRTVGYCIGENDMKLAKTLTHAGTEHRKFLRMVTIYMDITAPLYWWKEFSTYKVGTVANSCSTMHKLDSRDLTLDDFSHEHLTEGVIRDVLDPLISTLNNARECYITFEKKNENPELWENGISCKKDIWWQMIQLLPSSYNQRRTVMLNYEVALNILRQRSNHKLDEWHTLCDELRKLPYMDELTKEVDNG